MKWKKIVAILDEKGYLSDQEAAYIFGDESFCWKKDAYVSRWRRLRYDESYFASKKIVEKIKLNRMYLVKIEGEDNYTNCCKDFWNKIKI